MKPISSHRSTPKAWSSASFTEHIASTTHHYVEADLMMKERALARLHEPDVKIQRYRAPDSLTDVLKTL